MLVFGDVLAMSTSAKIKASRRNGKKSRGPKGAGGKEISSRNRFLYTIDPSRFITSGEDAAEFRKMAKSVLGQWQPRIEYERMWVHRLIRLLWRLRRLEQMELAILTGGVTGLGLPTGFEIPNEEARLEALPRILDL